MAYATAMLGINVISVRMLYNEINSQSIILKNILIRKIIRH